MNKKPAILNIQPSNSQQFEIPREAHTIIPHSELKKSPAPNKAGDQLFSVSAYQKPYTALFTAATALSTEVLYELNSDLKPDRSL